MRIWRIGTKRMLGVTAGPRADDADEPIAPKEMLVFKHGDEELFGDFEVCPFTAEREGAMQMVCVESVAHLVIKRPSAAVTLVSPPPLADAPLPRQIRPEVATGLLCGSVAPESGHASESGVQTGSSTQTRFDSLCRVAARRPPYPPKAKLLGIEGPVTMKAVIDEDGVVESLQVIDGHPMLVSAAMEAVKQWKYKPYYENGKPVAVETTIVVNFSLSGTNDHKQAGQTQQ